jgi:2-dehydro-3-deoxyphosphooctonate aldolase (KDO 8-P synthase)
MCTPKKTEGIPLNNAPFIFIAGPCVIESELLLDEVGSQMQVILKSHSTWDYFFKASFDKANRSSKNSFRGPGLEKGLQQLECL